MTLMSDFGLMNEPDTQVFEEGGAMLLWVYDLGDGWMHEIKAEDIIGPHKAKGEVSVLGGKRAVWDLAKLTALPLYVSLSFLHLNQPS